jgi:hypothetical protein
MGGKNNEGAIMSEIRPRNGRRLAPGHELVGVSLMQEGEAGRQVALRIARVAMGLDSMNGDRCFYRASDGVLGLVLDEESFQALRA